MLSKAEIERQESRQRLYREQLREELLDVKIGSEKLDQNSLKAGHVGINEGLATEQIRAMIRDARMSLEDAYELLEAGR